MAKVHRGVNFPKIKQEVKKKKNFNKSSCYNLKNDFNI